jgi:hypothetical protein
VGRKRTGRRPRRPPFHRHSPLLKKFASMPLKCCRSGYRVQATGLAQLTRLSDGDKPPLYLTLLWRTRLSQLPTNCQAGSCHNRRILPHSTCPISPHSSCRSLWTSPSRRALFPWFWLANPKGAQGVTFFGYGPRKQRAVLKINSEHSRSANQFQRSVGAAFDQPNWENQTLIQLPDPNPKTN